MPGDRYELKTIRWMGTSRAAIRMRHQITRGTAYEALGFSPEESAVRAMRVLLAAEIERFVRARRLTQTAAAKFFGVTQPRISNVLNRKLEGFSIDLLVKMVSRTGRVPTVSFRRGTGSRGRSGERRSDQSRARA